MNNKISESFAKATRKGKVMIILGSLLALFLLIIFSIYILGVSIRNFPGNDPNLSPFHYALGTSFGKPLSILFALIILFAFILLFLSSNKRNYSIKKDERGVHYMAQKTFGSAEWMDKERAKEVFTVCNIKDTNEVIYGQFTTNGEEVVGYKKPVNRAEFNRNIFVLAPAGSGKSYTQVKTDIVQHIKAGNSVAVTDPDGSLYGDFAKFARANGYHVITINFAEPAYSECWDIIKECIDPDTERLSGTRLNMFVGTFMANTGEGKKDFFYNSAANLIKAVIGYTSYWNEKTIIADYDRLFMKVCNLKVRNDDEYFEKTENSLVSFKWCREYITEKALERGYKKEDLDVIFAKIKEHADTATPFTIAEVYKNIIHFNEVEEFMNRGAKPIGNWHPAAINYEVYKSNDSEQVRKSAIQGAQLRFDVFIDSNITYSLSHEGLDLNRFNMEKTCLFVLTQDKSDETDPLASLLFTFLFKDVQDVYDKQKRLAQGEKRENPCLGSAIILDDFFSLGVIGGNPRVFARTMADARKRQVYITIVVQQYSQIEALYGANYNHSIQGNCATLIYLGGNDPDTIRFISEFGGEATALAESHRDQSKILSLGSLSSEYNSSSAQRDLMTRGESRTWKDHILVIQQGEQPLNLQPFTWKELPEYKEGKIEPTSIYSEIKPIYNREQKNKKKSKGEVEEEIQVTLDKLINRLRNFDVCEETGEVIERSKGNNNAPKEQKSQKSESVPELEADSIRDEGSEEVTERADTASPPIPVQTDLNFSQLRKEIENAN